MRSVNVLVVGGGASGMMAAINAASRGVGVLIIEHMDKLGKKITATGNGKCNYTNLKQSTDYYYSKDKAFVKSVLDSFGSDETIDFFKSLGILPLVRDGYVYPLSEQAQAVRSVLAREVKKRGCQVNLNESVLCVEKHTDRRGEQDGYLVKTDKNKYLARNVIFASGGKASPVHGSDGSGYSMLEKLGHRIVTPLPALTYCTVPDRYAKLWAGVRCTGRVTVCSADGKKLAQDMGGLQFVANGVSGIPVFQISRFVSGELEAGGKPYLVLDIMPEYSEEELLAELGQRIGRAVVDEPVLTIFEGMLNDRMAKALLTRLGMENVLPDKLTEKALADMAGLLKGWRVDVSGTAGFDKSQVTRGGVELSMINPETMESKLCTGVFVTGELLDVDAICGGYNLQWAWSTGYIAGHSVMADASHKKSKK